MNRRWQRLPVVSLFLILSCATESTRRTESIGIDVPERTMVGVYRVVLDGRTAGWVQTWVYADSDADPGNNPRQDLVLDTERRAVGFVTESGKAYRFRAHSDPELAGAAARLDQNVRTLLGIVGGELVLEDQLRTTGEGGSPHPPAAEKLSAAEAAK